MSDAFIFGKKRAFKDFTLQSVLALAKDQLTVESALSSLRDLNQAKNCSELLFAYRTWEGEDCCSDDIGPKLLLCLQRQKAWNCLVFLMIWSELPASTILELPSAVLEAARDLCTALPHPPLEPTTELSSLEAADLPAAPLPLFSKSPKQLTRLPDQQCCDAQTALTKALRSIKTISPQRFLLLCSNAAFLCCLDAVQVLVEGPVTGKTLWKLLNQVQFVNVPLAKIREVRSLLQQLPSDLTPETRAVVDYLRSLVALRMQTQLRFPQLSSPEKSPHPRRIDTYMQQKAASALKRKATSVDPKPPSAKYISEQTQANPDSILGSPKGERIVLTPKVVTVPKPGSLPESAERIMAEARRKEDDVNYRIEKLIKLKFEEVDTQEANIDSLTNEQIERLLASTKLEDVQYSVLLAMLKRLKQARLKMLRKVFW